MSKNGYTLVELLLGVTISVMIFMTAASVVALMFRSDAKTKRVETLEQTKNDIQGELTSNVRWGENITFSRNLLTIDSTVYKLQDGRIFKNSDPLTSSEVNIKSFQIEDFSNSPVIKSLELTIEMENKTVSSTKDTLRFVVSQRKTSFEEKP